MSKAGHVLSVLAILVTLAGCGGGAVGHLPDPAR
jgi:predicted small lipoprotein YifL